LRTYDDDTRRSTEQQMISQLTEARGKSTHGSRSTCGLLMNSAKTSKRRLGMTEPRSLSVSTTLPTKSRRLLLRHLKTTLINQLMTSSAGLFTSKLRRNSKLSV